MKVFIKIKAVSPRWSGYFILPVLKSKDHTGCSGNMTEVYKNAKSYHDLILRNTIALPQFYKRGKNRETWFT